MGFTTSERNNNITVTKAHAYVRDAKETVFFDMTVNGVSIYGCRFLNGSKGDFVAFPQTKGGDKYYNIAWVELTDEDVKTIKTQIKAILEIQ